MPTRFILAALLLCSFIACNQAKQKEAPVSSLKRSPNPPPAAGSIEHEDLLFRADTTAVAGDNNPDQQQANTPNTSPRQTPAPGSPATPAPSNPDWDKKIVKTANLNIEVKNYRVFNDVLHRKIREAGGYVAQEEQNDNGYKIENSIVIKVPVDRFDETVMQLAADSDKVLMKKIATEDVSMQLVDIRSRLATKKEVRQRYMEILHQAHKTEDVLNAQQQIDEIQEQLDGAAGRMAYLGHAAAYSTINLVYFQVLDLTAQKESDPSFYRGLKKALGEGWQTLSAILIGLVTVWPLWLAAGLAWMGWKKWRRLPPGRPMRARGQEGQDATAV